MEVMRTASLITAKEFETISQSLGSCELVRGEVVRLSPGGFQHSRIALRVGFLLEQWARSSHRGRVLTCEAGVVVETDPDTVRGADVAYVSYSRIPIGQEPVGFFSTPPELVVEVVGAGRGWKDMIDKAGEYLALGVDRVWVLDPKSRRIHIFRSDAEPVALDDSAVLRDDDVLPGFSCLVRQFLDD